MVCIYCGSKTSVVNTRLQRRTNATWRRRQCKRCNSIFTSIESADLTTSFMVEKSASDIEPFSRDRLLISIFNSLKHRESALLEAKELTFTIISKLVNGSQTPTLHRSDIVLITAGVLEKFDTAAAVHYQAFHQS